MPSNAQMSADYYALSIVDYWDKQRTEARALLIKEGDDNRAYIRSLETAIRAADDDIRGWAGVSDARERAEMQALVRRNKQAQADARRRARNSNKAQKGAESALSKPEDKAAKAATGQAEGALGIGELFEGLKGQEDEKAIAEMVTSLGATGTDLARVLEEYKVGSPDSPGTRDQRIAVAHGVVRALESVKHRRRGAGPSDRAMRIAAARLVGLPDNQAVLINTYDALVQEEVGKAASTVQSASTSGAGVAAVAADLEARGWEPFDFLPEMEVDALKARRSDLERKLAAAESEKVTDLDAALESEMGRRTRGVGEGLQFGGGLLGAIRFGAHNKRRMEAAETSLAEAEGKMSRLNAMSPNDKRLYIATARGMQSFGEYGSSRPTDADERLWGLGAQIATMHRSGGFKNAGAMVQNARALIEGVDAYKNLSPEEKEVLLDQVLEFSSMQQLEGFAPPGQGVLFLGEDEEDYPDEVAADSIDSASRREAAKKKAKKRGKTKQQLQETGVAAAKAAKPPVVSPLVEKPAGLIEAERLLAQYSRNRDRIAQDPSSSAAKKRIAQGEVDAARAEVDRLNSQWSASLDQKLETSDLRHIEYEDFDAMLGQTTHGVSSADPRIDRGARRNPPRGQPPIAGGAGFLAGKAGPAFSAAFEAGLARDVSVNDMAIAINEAIADGKTPRYRSASTIASEEGTYGDMFSPGGSAYSPSASEKQLRQAERIAAKARGDEAAEKRLRDEEYLAENEHLIGVFERTREGTLDSEALLLEAASR